MLNKKIENNLKTKHEIKNYPTNDITDRLYFLVRNHLFRDRNKIDYIYENWDYENKENDNILKGLEIHNETDLEHYFNIVEFNSWNHIREYMNNVLPDLEHFLRICLEILDEHIWNYD